MPKRLILVLAIPLLWLLAAIGYDDSPDAEMLRQWETLPQVPDTNNLFYALHGLGSADTIPLHEAGQKRLKEPWSATPKDERFVAYLGLIQKACRAIPEGNQPCYAAQSPEPIVPSMELLATQYRDLRHYTAFRSQMHRDGIIRLPQFFTAHSASLGRFITGATIQQVSLDELVTDTHFLREAMQLSDSVMDRVLFSVALVRNYRVAAELIEFGDAQQLIAIKPMLEALPPAALDLKAVLPYEYMAQRNGYTVLKQAIARGEDPLKPLAGMMGMPSPVPETEWERRYKMLWFKPEMTAKVVLNLAREDLGLPSSASKNPLTHGLHVTLNSTGREIIHFQNLGDGWAPYLNRMADLDHFVRLVVLVGQLAAEKAPFDPAKVVADWNGKLAANATEYRLTWDEQRTAFTFNPTGTSWIANAKQAGHGVLVRVPPRLIPAPAKIRR